MLECANLRLREFGRRPSSPMSEEAADALAISVHLADVVANIIAVILYDADESTRR